ncbi:MFS transporter [Lysobacter korlensis]|uniref:MFS transporter n=1 Tax=Lysobacter korlensis TaxID=553636 RepID=A0ABV6RTK4_9GAMM
MIRRPGILTGTNIAAFLAVVHAVNDALTAVLGALLPMLHARFAASTTTLALLVAVWSVSSSVTQPFLGALAERIGLRRVAAIGVALAAISLSLVSTAGDVILLALLLVLGGIGSAALHPVSTSIVGGESAKNPGLAVGMFTAGGMAGFAAGPVVILSLVSVYGVGVGPWLMLPGLLLAVAIAALLPQWEPHRRRAVRRRRSGLLLNRKIVLLTVAGTLVSLVFITFTSSVPLWLVVEAGLAADAPLLGWILAAFSLAAGLGAIGGGALGEKLGYARTTGITLLAAVVPMIAVIFLPPGPATVAVGAVAGALIYASQPLLIVAAQAAVPGAPAAAAGVVIGVAHAAAGLIYIGVGALQGGIGLAPAMAATFALLVPAAVIAYAALRMSR